MSTQRRLSRCYTIPLTFCVCDACLPILEKRAGCSRGTILHFRVQGGNIFGRSFHGVELRDHEHPARPPAHTPTHRQGLEIFFYASLEYGILDSKDNKSRLARDARTVISSLFLVVNRSRVILYCIHRNTILK